MESLDVSVFESLDVSVFENVAMYLTNDVMNSIKDSSTIMKQTIEKINSDGWHWKLKLEDYLSSIVGYSVFLRDLTLQDDTNWKQLYDTVVNSVHLADTQDPLIQELIVLPLRFDREDYVVDNAVQTGDLEAVERALKIVKADSVYDDTIFTTFLMGSEEIMKAVFPIPYEGKYVNDIPNAVAISAGNNIVVEVGSDDALDYLIYRCAYFGNTAVITDMFIWVHFEHDFGDLTLIALQQGHYDTAEVIVQHVIAEGGEFDSEVLVEELQDPKAESIWNLLMINGYAEEFASIMEKHSLM